MPAREKGMNVSEQTYLMIIPLFTAHALVDFVLQSEEDVSSKHLPLVLFKHSFLVAITSYIFMGLWRLWAIPLVILISHFVIDYFKVKMSRDDLKIFLIDQFAHIIVIVAVSALFSLASPFSTSNYWETLFGRLYYSSLVFISGAIITIYAGRIVVGIIVEPFLEQLRDIRKESSSNSLLVNERLARGFENGGMVIGQLERGMIFLLILVNQPAAIGFLIAAKSVFRFGEIKEKSNRMEAEYILIGTLVSFLFGLTFSFLTREIIAWL